jgi:hypothetical protein
MPVANGVLPLTPLNTWVNCDLDSLAKIQSSACIYDKQVYTETDGKLGYDVCQAQFEPGSYIFEDSFEYWRNSTLKSNIMKSAKWSKIVNGKALCIFIYVFVLIHIVKFLENCAVLIRPFE